MCTNPYKIEQDIWHEELNEYVKETLLVPCGKCWMCRKRKAKDWAIKLINEAKYHKEACFITLTFDNKILLDENSKARKMGALPNFPYTINASKEYFKKFMKRLRKKFSYKKITFYHIGEYGEKTHRAHHHAILFGVNFNEDAKKAELSKSGKEQFFSQTLEDLWACGRTRFQLINDNNIMYIAGYTQKKYVNKFKTIKIIENGKITYKKVLDENKQVQSFSNRSKMSVKWIRKHPEQLQRLYLEDKDGKKYAIPKSYVKEMKKENKKNENPLYVESYKIYDERLNDFICNTDFNLMREEEERKSYIENKRASKKTRDFE